ncbi:autotransporter outer membrane beta-barrel domain-containing protein [Xenorhabdus hominickii]|uniref:Autotransporter outer membrane beta-barrel domain-containing protein n=1 Tax=Xenorhabdus hominickii TaxID=351679 RepID=A0A2G0Q319_XENHO|nr:autotransporter domain-containing protein [Xenorhabdus hominickii]AOM39829.1 autotransporter outer membrane beta-barrel domain-containing protein [Xenorhabdus hominickii]PHM53609.1 outer membrane esterase [Xenorhabdus hominickii]
MKTAYWVTSATTVFLINFITNAYAYNNVYVFGDSLSDGGNLGRFTTNGNDSELYDEYIARILTGKKLITSNDGGTNYAEGGTTADGSTDWVTKEILFDPTTKKQVNNYLDTHAGRAEPNGLYIHWVGGNNLSEALEYAAKGNQDEAQRIIDTSSTAAASQVNQLINAGAGLIIVPNVPDIGTTPKVLEKVLNGALEQSKIPSEEIDAILKQTHETINKYPTPNTSIRRQVIEGIFKKVADNAAAKDPIEAQKIYLKLLTAYDKNSQIASQSSDEYNQKVDNQLGNGNILRADVNRLLREVIDNPTIYGVSNTLGYACPQGSLALLCDSTDPDFDKSQSFLFSDSFHPTPYAHQVIGQYIMSIYNAPLQVMVLNQINRMPVTAAQSSLDGHLQQLRNGSNAQGEIGVFGGYTGYRNNTFTLGSDYQLTDNFLLGATVSRYRDEQNTSSDFTYADTAHVVTAYALLNYYHKGWLSGDVHYSHANYDSLIRTIQLGKATRREIGSTTGNQWGVRITAGWNIPITNYLTTSPILQYVWDKGSISSYRESGNNSTSMHFGDQNYNSQSGSVGWSLDTQLGSFNPYASILFNHQFDNESGTLRSAINSTKTSFVQKREKQDRNRFQYTIGVNANLNNGFRAFAAVSHEDKGTEARNNYNFNFGINVRF